MEEQKNKIGGLEFWFDEPTESFKVACRLCGEVWTFSSIYKNLIEPGWECPNCRRQWREIHGSDMVR